METESGEFRAFTLPKEDGGLYSYTESAVQMAKTLTSFLPSSLQKQPSKEGLWSARLMTGGQPLSTVAVVVYGGGGLAVWAVQAEGVQLTLWAPDAGRGEATVLWHKEGELATYGEVAAMAAPDGSVAIYGGRTGGRAIRRLRVEGGGRVHLKAGGMGLVVASEEYITLYDGSLQPIRRWDAAPQGVVMGVSNGVWLALTSCVDADDTPIHSTMEYDMEVAARQALAQVGATGAVKPRAPGTGSVQVVSSQDDHCLAIWSAHRHALKHIEWSVRGTHVVTASDGRSLAVWQVQDASTIVSRGRLRRGYSSASQHAGTALLDVARSHHGWTAAVSARGTVHVWPPHNDDGDDGDDSVHEAKHRLRLGGGTSSERHVLVFSSNGTLYTLALSSGALLAWNPSIISSSSSSSSSSSLVAVGGLSLLDVPAVSAIVSPSSACELNSMMSSSSITSSMSTPSWHALVELRCGPTPRAAALRSCEQFTFIHDQHVQEVKKQQEEEVKEVNEVKEEVVKEDVVKEDVVKEEVKEDVVKEDVVKEDVVASNNVLSNNSASNNNNASNNDASNNDASNNDASNNELIDMTSQSISPPPLLSSPLLVPKHKEEQHDDSMSHRSASPAAAPPSVYLSSSMSDDGVAAAPPSWDGWIDHDDDDDHDHDDDDEVDVEDLHHPPSSSSPSLGSSPEDLAPPTELAPPEPELNRRCGDCGQMRPRKMYSNTQWRKSSGHIRCKTCVEGRSPEL